MTKAQMFEMDTDGFPALAAIILAEREISSAREWVEEGGLSQDEFDLKRAVELAKEATMSKEDSDESPSIDTSGTTDRPSSSSGGQTKTPTTCGWSSTRKLGRCTHAVRTCGNGRLSKILRRYGLSPIVWES